MMGKFKRGFIGQNQEKVFLTGALKKEGKEMGSPLTPLGGR